MCGTTMAQQTITNPIAPVGQDPWVIQHEGYYYYCYSHDGSIWVNRHRLLQEACRFNGVKVWTPPEGEAYSRSLWAPELHLLNGTWYVYVAADDGRNESHRMYVLKSVTGDPMGDYEFAGKVSDPSDRWAIDGTVLEHDGKLYFIWSGWEGDRDVQQDLYIALMADPQTIAGERITISVPEYEWEKVGRPLVNEGPQVLKHGDDVFIIYSASGSWTDDYCLGQLKLVGDDPLDPASWEKLPNPVFSSTDTVFSPGHASFTKSPDQSEDWIVYHTARHKGAGWHRDVNIKQFTWDENGNPVFGVPEKGVEIPAPGGS